MYEFLELRAASSYLIAVVAITERYRDRHLRLFSTAFVSWGVYFSASDFDVSDVCCAISA